MVNRSVWTAVVLGACLALFAPGARGAEPAPDDAAGLFARGQGLLQKGAFLEAQKSFASASRAEPKNDVYKQYALVLRRVVALRKAVAKGEPSPKWEKMVASLHGFYLRHRVLTAALELDRMAHGKLQNTESEARFAETLLECGAEVEAAEMLARPAAWKRDARHATAHGIALGRLGRVEEALVIAKRTSVPSDASALLLRDRARLENRIGHQADALAVLQRCFEATPAATLPEMKTWVRANSDLKTLAAHANFEKVMKTGSKVAAASCSGGKDCGSCPKRGGCSKK